MFFRDGCAARMISTARIGSFMVLPSCWTDETEAMMCLEAPPKALEVIV
jgi:hypothetical protein